MAASPTVNLGFQNFYSTTLSSDITASATDIFLDAVPSVSEGFLVIDPDSPTAREVIYYNSKTATKVTCPSAADGRGQGDTSASAHLTGTTVIMAPIAEYFETLLSLFNTSPQGWTSAGAAITGVTYNGNRSYDVTVDTDLTAVITPGMRLRTTRTVAAPTQSTSLNGTNQYYSKTTPAGMTFTDDFVVSAWVKLSSYANGTIISRFSSSGTNNGWFLSVNSSGQVLLAGFSASTSRTVTSYQSLPLNKWVYVTAQLDMSASTATTTTCYVMIDGVDVPAVVTSSGTPSALTQAGNLDVGARNSAAGIEQYFPGKIAQAAVFSAKVTQATMRGYMSQGLTGTETSLVSAYSFNGVITDLNTTNANNLTANGSAVATNADSPFGGQAGGTISSTLDYGIVQKVTASTLTVQVAEGCTIPTSGGVASASYSTYKSPYGFPGDRDKWRVAYLNRTIATQSGPAASTWYNPSSQSLSVPVGSWTVGYECLSYLTRAASGFCPIATTLSTGASTNTYSDLAGKVYATAITEIMGFVKREKTITLGAVTILYLNLFTSVSGVTNLNTSGGDGDTQIYADNALL